MVASFAGSVDYTSATSDAVTFTITKSNPNLAVTDAGGVYTGSTFPASVTVTGLSGHAASSLEGVIPTVAHYACATATGTPLSGAPSAAGTYTAVATFVGSQVTPRDQRSTDIHDCRGDSEGNGQRLKRRLQRFTIRRHRDGDWGIGRRRFQPGRRYAGLHVLRRQYRNRHAAQRVAQHGRHIYRGRQLCRNRIMPR